MVIKNSQVELTPDTKGNPVYEIIKKEDIQAAFRDALTPALREVLKQIDSLIATMTATAPQGVWTWDFTARWGFDIWY